MVYIYHIILTLENVKIINNSLTGSAGYSEGYTCVIIKAEYSYLKYKSYNEISKNIAHSIIMSLSIHVCENSILNFSFKHFKFNVEIYTLQK